MNLLINQFTVRYQGKDYGPGSVIYNMNKKEAAALIAGSNGTIVALPEREEEPVNLETPPKVETPNGRKRNATTADKTANTDAIEEVEDITALPAIDPSQTVK